MDPADADTPDSAGPPETSAPGSSAGSSGAALPQNGGSATLRVRPVDLRDYAQFRPGEAKRTRVFATERLALDLWCIEPGASTGVLHYPDQDVTYTVIGGRSWFVTDDGEVGLDPMGAVLVPADTVHGVDTRSPDPLVVLATSAPPGTDAEEPAVAEDQAAVNWPRGRPGFLRRLLDVVTGGGRAEAAR